MKKKWRTKEWRRKNDSTENVFLRSICQRHFRNLQTLKSSRYMEAATLIEYLYTPRVDKNKLYPPIFRLPFRDLTSSRFSQKLYRVIKERKKPYGHELHSSYIIFSSYSIGSWNKNLYYWKYKIIFELTNFQTQPK